MAKFKVGDICILVNAVLHKELNGTELTITGLPVEFICSGSGTKTIGYPTDLVHKGIPVLPMVHQLRLKDNPPDAIVMREYNRLIEKLMDKVST